MIWDVISEEGKNFLILAAIVLPFFAAMIWLPINRSKPILFVFFALIIGLVSIVIIGVLVTAGTGWINSITSNVTSSIG